MQGRFTFYLGLLLIAFMFMGSTPIAIVGAQEVQQSPSRLFLPMLSSSEAGRSVTQTEQPPAEPTPVEETDCYKNTPIGLPPCAGFSFPPGITRFEDLPVCHKNSVEEELEISRGQIERMAANGGIDPQTAIGLADKVAHCREANDDWQPMLGPAGDPLDGQDLPVITQSKKP